MNSNATQTLTAVTPQRPDTASASANTTHNPPANRIRSARRSLWSASQAQL
jgi:hypothetical protein